MGGREGRTGCWGSPNGGSWFPFLRGCENPQSRTSLVESISRLYILFFGDLTGARQSDLACDGIDPTGPQQFFGGPSFPELPLHPALEPPGHGNRSGTLGPEGSQAGRAAPFSAYVRCSCAWGPFFCRSSASLKQHTRHPNEPLTIEPLLPPMLARRRSPDISTCASPQCDVLGFIFLVGSGSCEKKEGP